MGLSLHYLQMSIIEQQNNEEIDLDGVIYSDANSSNRNRSPKIWERSFYKYLFTQDSYIVVPIMWCFPHPS